MPYQVRQPGCRTATPYVRSHRPAGGQPPGRQHQHRAAAPAHVQDVLIAAQAQLIQQLRQIARLPGPVEYRYYSDSRVIPTPAPSRA
jgi:hypothetical protein